MELLQVQGMTDVVFGFKDLITIGGGLIATGGTILTLKLNAKATEKANEKRFKDIEERAAEDKTKFHEELMNATNGRRAIEKKASMDLKEKDMLIQKRIDKTQDKLDKEIEKNAEEFKQINSAISGIKVEDRKSVV